MCAQKKGLGKGLDVFFGSADDNIDKIDLSEDDKKILQIDINKIEPNRDQPRKFFDEYALNELADSIAEFGIIQPILVNKEDGYYSIVAGERRWRAARIAKLTEVPIIVKDYTNKEILEVALIENLQRTDLNPIEEANSYKKLIDEYNLTQENIAQRVSKSRSTITNALRLLNLDYRVQNFITENKITMGHARALLSITDFDTQLEFAEAIIEDGLSVREIEALVREFLNPSIAKPKIESTQDPNIKLLYKQFEQDLTSLLGTKVKIKNGKNKGKIEIEYLNTDDFERVLSILKQVNN